MYLNPLNIHSFKGLFWCFFNMLGPKDSNYGHILGMPFLMILYKPSSGCRETQEVHSMCLVSFVQRPATIRSMSLTAPKAGIIVQKFFYDITLSRERFRCT